MTSASVSDLVTRLLLLESFKTHFASTCSRRAAHGVRARRLRARDFHDIRAGCIMELFCKLKTTDTNGVFSSCD